MNEKIVNCANKIRAEGAEIMNSAYYSVVGGIGMLMASANVAFAEETAGADIFAKAKSMLTEVYGKLTGITTILAVVCATIALLMRMFSQNQKTVDTATQWLKRIIISWCLIFGVTYVLNMLQTLVGDGVYKG